MLIYRSFIYLQNHKTGCSFVERCLRDFCNEPLLHYHKHAALKQVPNRFCFTNVREPLTQYRSLYRYGLDGKGAIFKRLRHFGHLQLYRDPAGGFDRWLAFVLQPRHASLLDPYYTPALARSIGLMTWRLLRLGCPGLEQTAKQIQHSGQLRNYVRQRYVLNAVLRQEQLRSDLKRLIQDQLAACFTDQSAVANWLDNSPSINTSSASLDHQLPPQPLLATLIKRESFIYQRFYPQQLQQYQRADQL